MLNSSKRKDKIFWTKLQQEFPECNVFLISFSVKFNSLCVTQVFEIHIVMGFTVYMKIINSSCIMEMRYNLVYYLGLSVFTSKQHTC